MRSLIEKISRRFLRWSSNRSGTNRNEALRRLKLELLKGKTWRYLRYIHARQALTMVTDWKSVVIIGGGAGLAEIALAIEFPNKKFHITDHEGATHTFNRARHFVEEFKLNNVTFGRLNILSAQEKKYDIVYSVEVLEHIKKDKEAALNMCDCAKKYIFCLVPFAEEEVNNNSEIRKEVFEKFEHYVAGYDEKTLMSLFPRPIAIRGCYWREAGIPFRSKLTKMDESEIKVEFNNLLDEAHMDIKNQVQETTKEALGIWILSDAKRP